MGSVTEYKGAFDAAGLASLDNVMQAWLQYKRSAGYMEAKAWIDNNHNDPALFTAFVAGCIAAYGLYKGVEGQVRRPPD